LRISERATADGGRVAIYTDISEIKRQEQLLRQQDQAAHRQLLEATVNSLRQGIAVFDQHSRLLAWNHRFCELAGLHRQPVHRRGLPVMRKFRCYAR
jgi:PAS domain-containing protein